MTSLIVCSPLSRVDAQDIMLPSPLSALDAQAAAEDQLSWEQNERLLNQADEDEEADAEADVTEADPAVWTSFMPTWINSPDDLETSDDAAPASSINWSFQVTHLTLQPCSLCCSVLPWLETSCCIAELAWSAQGMPHLADFARLADLPEVEEVFRLKRSRLPCPASQIPILIRSGMLLKDAI